MENNEKPILSIIQQIKEGSLEPKEIDKEKRKQIVETLSLEGYGVASMAQILQVSEKTIKRDLVTIRQQNALSPDVELVKQQIGELLAKAQACSSHLMRLARSANGSIGEKANAEYFAWKVNKELAEIMQAVGYLPEQAHKVVAEHHIYPERTLEEMENEVKQVMAIAEKTGVNSSSLKENATAILAQIEKTKIEKQVKDLVQQQETIENKEKEESHE